MQPGAHGIQQKDKAPSFHTGKGLEYTLPKEDTDGQESTHEAQRHSPSGNANQTREVSPPPGRPLQAAHDRRQSQEAAGVGTRRRRPSSPLLGEEGGPAATPTAWQLPVSWVHRRRTTGTQADGLGPGRAARAPGAGGGCHTVSTETRGDRKRRMIGSTESGARLSHRGRAEPPLGGRNRAGDGRGGAGRSQSQRQAAWRPRGGRARPSRPPEGEADGGSGEGGTVPACCSASGARSVSCVLARQKLRRTRERAHRSGGQRCTATCQGRHGLQEVRRQDSPGASGRNLPRGRCPDVGPGDRVGRQPPKGKGMTACCPGQRCARRVAGVGAGATPARAHPRLGPEPGGQCRGRQGTTSSLSHLVALLGFSVRLPGV